MSESNVQLRWSVGDAVRLMYPKSSCSGVDREGYDHHHGHVAVVVGLRYTDHNNVLYRVRCADGWTATLPDLFLRDLHPVRRGWLGGLRLRK